MCDFLLITEDGFLQIDVKVHVEVVLDAFEHVVSLLLQLDHDVTLDHIRHLLSLLLVQDLLHVQHTFLDIERQCLGVHNDLLTTASTTVFLVHATLSLALRARLIHLHLHEAHVLDHLHHPLSLTLGAGLGLAALSTTTFTFGAVDVAVDVELFLATSVELFKSHRVLKLMLGAFPAVVTSPFVAFDLIFTLSVVDLSLVLI